MDGASDSFPVFFFAVMGFAFRISCIEWMFFGLLIPRFVIRASFLFLLRAASFGFHLSGSEFHVFFFGFVFRFSGFKF